jgi:hypothetical protein
MIFENQDGKPVEVNRRTFECVLRESQLGLTAVKLKGDSSEYWLKATEHEILKAASAE